ENYLRPHPKRTPMSEDWYPSAARRQDLTGRVLLAFRLDDTGKAQDVRLVQADAARVLQAAAGDMLKATPVDIPTPTAEPGPHAVSISFCMVTCGDLQPYAGFAPIVVTAWHDMPIPR